MGFGYTASFRLIYESPAAGAVATYRFLLLTAFTCFDRTSGGTIPVTPGLRNVNHHGVFSPVSEPAEGPAAFRDGRWPCPTGPNRGIGLPS